MNIIDSHVHIFPDKIADKASIAIQTFYDDFHKMDANGRVDKLIEDMKANNIKHAVVFSAATVPAQVKAINDFIAKTVKDHGDIFTGFGTLHPDMENPQEEIDRIIEMGLKGIKFHPDFQGFKADDEKTLPMYEYIQEKNLPIIFHTGDKRYNFSSPHRIAKVSDMFPNLKIVAAHMGGWSEVRQAMEWIVPRKSIMVDTCSSIYDMSDEQTLELIRLYGSKRVLFATDYPMWDYLDVECQKIKRIDLTEEEKEDIFYKNAQRFFGIEI